MQQIVKNWALKPLIETGWGLLRKVDWNANSLFRREFRSSIRVIMIKVSR